MPTTPNPYRPHSVTFPDGSEHVAKRTINERLGQTFYTVPRLHEIAPGAVVQVDGTPMRVPECIEPVA